jgi:ABC-type sulfate transport system permease subunit
MEHILFGIAILVLIMLFVGMPFIIRGIGHLAANQKQVKVALPVGCHGCQSLNCPRNPERHTPLVD